jgi:hypothetical protein
MDLKQRHRHRLIWGLLAILLPLLFLTALWFRPQAVTQPDPLSESKTDSLTLMSKPH